MKEGQNNKYDITKTLGVVQVFFEKEKIYGKM